jgi:predicted homoserine dehydrogenase-like protein
MHLVGVADLDVARGRRALQSASWPDEACANSLGDALAQGRSYVTEDAAALIASSGIEVIVRRPVTPRPASATRSPPSPSASISSW